ncbi:glycosyltransferase [Leuconostoc carnosum]|uniref:glycosyltransferase n=1 Tax=Leuconostoc carnosum TaxID=1252 RepID=UPI00123A138F|nr:glycosyltransferase [Leuconostoc carnosum]KAA8367998.1 glycosyl transferase [Leuconostoc carnosum]
MKILHYALGFPPERTGGLVKYSLDLMNEQICQGHEVIMAYPGRLNLLRKKPYFKFGKRQNIPYAELINSLPLPLIGNIKVPQDFMKSADIKIFKDFLETVKPDIIHIHTLMGLYLEFFKVANSLNIKVVFTTHDYFGISPHPKLYLAGHDFVDDHLNDIWNNIRTYGSRTVKLRVSQLSVYPNLRTFVKRVKKSSIAVDNSPERLEWSTERDSDFQELKNYYLNMLKYIDVVHFNSSVSKKVYEQFLPKMMWKTFTLPISSNNIENAGEISIQDKPIESIAYIGPYTREKGFFEYLKFANGFILKSSNNKAFIMGDDSSVQVDGIINLGKYDKTYFKKNINNVDLVILPSQWHETFGLIAIEVLSTGTKVIVSRKMGAIDIIPNWLQIDNVDNINLIKIQSRSAVIDIMSVDQHFEAVNQLYND